MSDFRKGGQADSAVLMEDILEGLANEAKWAQFRNKKEELWWDYTISRQCSAGITDM